jgi:hypothetical protein
MLLFIITALIAGIGCNKSSQSEPGKDAIISVSHQPCVHALPT